MHAWVTRRNDGHLPGGKGYVPAIPDNLLHAARGLPLKHAHNARLDASSAFDQVFAAGGDGAYGGDGSPASAFHTSLHDTVSQQSASMDDQFKHPPSPGFTIDLTQRDVPSEDLDGQQHIGILGVDEAETAHFPVSTLEAESLDESRSDPSLNGSCSSALGPAQPRPQRMVRPHSHHPQHEQAAQYRMHGMSERYRRNPAPKNGTKTAGNRSSEVRSVDAQAAHEHKKDYQQQSQQDFARRQYEHEHVSQTEFEGGPYPNDPRVMRLAVPALPYLGARSTPSPVPCTPFKAPADCEDQLDDYDIEAQTGRILRSSQALGTPELHSRKDPGEQSHAMDGQTAPITTTNRVPLCDPSAASTSKRPFEEMDNADAEAGNAADHTTMELDYELDKLYSMSYADLKGESFDYLPTTDATTLHSSEHGRNLSVKDQLAEIAKLQSADRQQSFSLLPMAAWEEVGTLLGQQFQDTVTELHRIRQEKRQIAARFEDVVKQKYEGLMAESRDLDEQLRAMKEQGQRLVQVSKTPSKTPRAAGHEKGNDSG